MQLVENIEGSVNLLMKFRSTARSYKSKNRKESRRFLVVSDRRTILGTHTHTQAFKLQIGPLIHTGNISNNRRYLFKKNLIFYAY